MKRCGIIISLFAALALAAMLLFGRSAGAGDCQATYENFGRAFMEKYCTKCHNSTVSGLSRYGAPAGLNFDKVEIIVKEKKEIIEWVVEKKKMPPLLSSPKPSDEERARLKSWLECEYP